LRFRGWCSWFVFVGSWLLLWARKPFCTDNLMASFISL
jgi:hypothetical protein